MLKSDWKLGAQDSQWVEMNDCAEEKEEKEKGRDIVTWDIDFRREPPPVLPGQLSSKCAGMP